MKNPLIGMRTVKTALVVILAYAVSLLLNQEPSFALIYAAVICIETSVVTSFNTGFNRVLGTVVGGVIGLIVSYIPLYGGFTMALGIAITIIFCNLLHIKKATGIAITLVIIIVTGSDSVAPGVYAMHRTLDTVIGIVLATMVNLLVFPPDPMKRVRESFHQFTHSAKQVVGDMMEFNLSEGLSDLGKRLDDLKEKFDNMNTEIPVLKRYEQEEYDYVVQMLEASERVYIYAEAIALTDPDVKMTRDNHLKLTKLLARDIQRTEFVDLEQSTREDMIFNYTLAKLISALEKVLKESPRFKE
ncbi:aromatic acid exporter family protein [Proteiniclasticum sp. BAD-10]|uniref:Aromatic acid exporter family protein n=1 Tax=Proteiniclasticum sediminis TaxID=2804028 RepID=A0A941HPV0_9CLOT|nr:aromatic acid exporter family protein [Proteiniclasticum sediminis]MBR0574768.1 aromatic acid exporter family protein [Proteiniclasticum sediminis]